MESDPTASPVEAKSIMVPPIVATLLIYGGLVVVAGLSNLIRFEPWSQDVWVSLPLALVAYSTPVFLFLAVFAINEKRAILVPICGVFAAALLAHYLRPRDSLDAGFEQELLRNDLWVAIKYALPVALLVSGLAVVAARWWAPRTEEESTRFEIPKVKPALVFFAISVAVAFALSYAVSRGESIHYLGSMIQTTAAEFSVIAMCLICAVALKGWTALLPLAIIAQGFATFYLPPGQCLAGGLGGEGGCWDFLWPLVRAQMFAFAVLFVLSVLAGAWGRDEGAAEIEPAVATGT